MKRRRQFPGATPYTDRHGRRRWRYRVPGFSAELGTGYGSDEFVRRYEEAVERRHSKGQAGAERTIPGSFSAVLASWYRTPDFRALKPNTARNYRSILERFREEHGHRRVAHLRPVDVQRILAKKADTPQAANRLRKLLRQVVRHAIFMELRADNPVDSVKPYKVSGDGFHTWTEPEIATYLAHHKPGTLAHLAMTLMLYTGAARVDAVRLGWANIEGNRLKYRRQKTEGQGGVLIDIPIHPELAAALNTCPGENFTFLQTQRGTSRSPNGLGNMMRKWCDDAGLPECGSHGLRKAIARRLAEAGATPNEIQSVTGHKSLAEVSRYTEKADRADSADRAFGKMGEGAANVTNLSERFVKKSGNALKKKGK